MSNRVEIPEEDVRLTYDRWMAREKSLADLAADYGVSDQTFIRQFRLRGWPGAAEVRGIGGPKKRSRPVLTKRAMKPELEKHPPHIFGTDGECCVCDVKRPGGVSSR